MEQKWIRAIQRRGSRRAAEELVNAYYDEIYRFACRQTGDREDAMDLTQNIFLAVLRALSTYDRRRAGFRTWLYRIAANKAVDARRRAGPATVPIDELDLPAAEDFAMAVQDRELLERIEDYVSGLSPCLWCFSGWKTACPSLCWRRCCFCSLPPCTPPSIC